MNGTLQGRLIIGKCWTINLRDKDVTLGFVVAHCCSSDTELYGFYFWIQLKDLTVFTMSQSQLYHNHNNNWQYLNNAIILLFTFKLCWNSNETLMP